MAGQCPTGRNYRCVAATIRFPGRKRAQTLEPAKCHQGEPGGSLGALLAAMPKEIDKSDLHGHRGPRQTDHETKNYALSEQLAAAAVLYEE